MVVVCEVRMMEQVAQYNKGSGTEVAWGVGWLAWSWGVLYRELGHVLGYKERDVLGDVLP